MKYFGTLVISLLFCAAFISGAVIDDTFGDGNSATNTDGLGTGWSTGSHHASAKEEAGAFTVTIGTEHGSYRMLGKDADEFNFWNTDGVTVTWTIWNSNIVTPHKYGNYFAFHWNLGIISANAPNTGWYHTGGCTYGAFYVDMGWKNQTSAKVRVFISNKTNETAEHTPEGEADLGDRFFTTSYPIVITATLKSSSWSVTTNQTYTSGSGKLSGNWTSDLNNSSPDLNAPITDEFHNGGFLYLMGRNSGIDGTGSFTANSSSLDRVTVQNNGTGPIKAPVPPDGLIATAEGTDMITLTWNDNSNDEDGFIITRRLSGDQTYSIHDTVDVGVKTFEDTGLDADTRYYYRVRAYNSAGESANTSTASAKTEAAGIMDAAGIACGPGGYGVAGRMFDLSGKPVLKNSRKGICFMKDNDGNVIMFIRLDK